MLLPSTIIRVILFHSNAPRTVSLTELKYNIHSYIETLAMTMSKPFVLVALALLGIAQTSSAMPRSSQPSVANLIKRAQVTFQDCGGDDDPRRTHAGTAWSEAANLAELTIDGTIDGGARFTDTKA